MKNTLKCSLSKSTKCDVCNNICKIGQEILPHSNPNPEYASRGLENKNKQPSDASVTLATLSTGKCQP